MQRDSGLWMRYGVLLLALMVWQAPAAFGQRKDQLPNERDAEREARAVEEQMQTYEKAAARGTASARQQFADLSFRNFVRGGIATGNLIQVPYVTNVNVSAGYFGGTVQPNTIQWPKGSGVAYGHTMTFMVAGEVINDAGDTLHIVSESYNRGGGDRHPSGSHQYFFNAVPGFYNMRGDPATRNRLNDNPDDRQLLQESGYYFVGGLSEDANNNGQLDEGEDLNGDGTLNTELINDVEYTAQSNLPQTWPAFWPPQTYPGDDRQWGDFRPGIRAGRWNGAYGSFIRADQESYYYADDRDNDEFAYYPFLNPATGEPDRRSWDEGGRRGLGVEVQTRQYQWASVLAEDIFIATFDVKNISRKDLSKMIIAMIVDYDIAGSTGDNRALFDTQDDITYQWLKRDLTVNGFKVGYAGVGFLESPGIANDGVDNDADGLTDESRENGLDDDGDWRTWVDVNGNGRFDNEDQNNNFILDLGEDLDGDGALTIEPTNDDVGSDGLGPEQEDYPGPDPDGTEVNGLPDRGEPNFEFTDKDEIDQIGLTNMVIRTPSDFDRDLDDDAVFWDEYIQPVPEEDFIVPSETADVIYVYSSGYSQIDMGNSQRFSLAFFCGNDFQDMLRNKRTMQNIYNADYNFSRPPNRPFLTAVPGNGKVTLVWDASAELSRDPIYGFDFEMYKVYRSTDPQFNDVKTITDAFGNPLLWTPLLTETGQKVQFDEENGLVGAHPVPIGDFGVSYDMGTDSGLQYAYVDSTVDNGRTYYYCVVSVDRGYHSSFFERGLTPYDNLAELSPTESSKIIEVDAFDRPTNVDRNCAVVVPQQHALGYVEPHLVDGVQQVTGDASGGLDVDFLIPDEANGQGYVYEVTFSDDNSYAALDSVFLENGLTTGFVFRNATTGDTLATSDPGARGARLFDSRALTVGVFDGMKFTLSGPAVPEPVQAAWVNNPESGGRGTSTPLTNVSVSAPDENTPVPRDYEVRVSTAGADTSNSLSASKRYVTNFSIWDITDPDFPLRVPFQLEEPAAALVPGDTVIGRLSPGDVVNVRISRIDFSGYDYYARSTWRFEFSPSDQAEDYLAETVLEANALYDSLASYSVRGFEQQPYGPDLDMRELYGFYERLDPWYDTVRDSLAQLPGLAVLVATAAPPRARLEIFDRILQTEIPVEGDRFRLVTSKPFDRDDVLRFQVEGHEMEAEIPEMALDDIYVVPDPYVAVNSLEARNVLLSGRGERRIDFRNLPQQCTIRIFTVSGRLVKVIEHNTSQDKSFASWNLQSDDGLDVSFGVYLYHVEAPGIGEKVGRFAIIK